MKNLNFMKFFIPALVLTGFVFVGCSDDEKEERDSLGLSEYTLEFGYDDVKAQSIEVITSASAFDYDLNEKDDWVNISKGEKKLTITVDLNPGDQREAHILVKAGTAESKSLTIKQKAFEEVISIDSDEDELSFGSDQGEETLTFTTNAEQVTVNWDKEKYDWIDASVSEKVLTVKVTANPDLEEREGFVYLKAEGAEDFEVKIIQGGRPVDITGTWNFTGLDMDLDEVSGTCTITATNVEGVYKVEDLFEDEGLWTEIRMDGNRIYYEQLRDLGYIHKYMGSLDAPVSTALMFMTEDGGMAAIDLGHKYYFDVNADFTKISAPGPIEYEGVDYDFISVGVVGEVDMGPAKQNVSLGSIFELELTKAP